MKMTQTLPAGSATLTNAENITNKERLSYGASDFACNIANGMVGTYLMYYYTDVLASQPARSEPCSSSPESWMQFPALLGEL